MNEEKQLERAVVTGKKQKENKIKQKSTKATQEKAAEQAPWLLCSLSLLGPGLVEGHQETASISWVHTKWRRMEKASGVGSR